MMQEVRLTPAQQLAALLHSRAELRAALILAGKVKRRNFGRTDDVTLRALRSALRRARDVRKASAKRPFIGLNALPRHPRGNRGK
jgi:hypothetical protein